MADDIDIEEHDLLDNPALRNIFPDMSALIQEIDSLQEIELSGEPAIVQTLNRETKELSRHSSPNKDTVDASYQHQINIEVTGEAIEEDSIPTDQTPMKREIDVIEIEDDPEIPLSNELINSNKIILGSKPNKCLEYEEEFFEEQVKSYNVSVILDDLKPYLESSGRFCQECLILFPNKNGLDSHNASYHTVPSDSIVFTSMQKTVCKSKEKVTNKSVKCLKCNLQFSAKTALYKHNKSFHSGIAQAQAIHKMISKAKDNIKKDDLPNLDENNECFHCKKIFTTQQSLIEHLYDILQSKKNICNVCSKNFSDSYELDKHMVSHKKCMLVINNISDQLQGRTAVNVNDVDKLRKNNYNSSTVKATDLSVIENVINRPSNVSIKNQSYYKCHICGYHFNDLNYLRAHLINKHNNADLRKEYEKTPFDGVCRFCTGLFRNYQNLNSHLISVHKEYLTKKASEEQSPNNFQTLNYDYDTMKNNENSNLSSIPLQSDNKTETASLICQKQYPKSVLFKCSKCDIHFLSAKVAKNHTEHMEMLINWKCSDCKHIFKNDDKIIHKEQHKYSKQFNIYDICPVTVSPILFKCGHCTIHYEEQKFYKHILTCRNETPDSIFCIICDILIDSALSQDHRDEHVNQNVKSADYVIVETDILADSGRNLQTSEADETISQHQVKLKETSYPIVSKQTKSESNRQTPQNRLETIAASYKTTRNLNDSRIEEPPPDMETLQHRKKSEDLKRKIDGTSGEPKKLKKIQDQRLRLTFCHTCQCFLAKPNKHILEGCKKSVTIVCRICGLTFTPASYQKTHKKLHQSMKNVKLNSFDYYDIKSGKQINLPIPKYPECDKCKIQFSDVLDIVSHNCGQVDYLICTFCNTNFTKEAFWLHVQFHEFLNADKATNSTKKVDSVASKETTKLFEQNIPRKFGVKQGSVINSKTLFKTTAKDKPNTKVARVVVSPLQTKTVNKGANIVVPTLHTKIVHKVNKTKTTSLRRQNREEKVDEKTITEAPAQNLNIQKINLEEIVYQCKQCCICVDSYDRVIEHCQDHYCDEEDTIESTECEVCELNFDSSCFDNHKKMHTSRKKNDFTVLSFDISYFTADNKMWVNHVFKTLPEVQYKEIINKSIYKHECRIKLDVIQNGSTDLTVYKCDQCRSFIDETSIYKHAENSCFKLRKHPCSICGLPFNSSVSRLQHEVIHEKPNINLKSYRIVTFNKEEDKALNKLLYCKSLYYILYQCRNCSVAVSKSQRKSHICSRKNVKTCLECQLQIFNDDYDSHVLKHRELPKFIQKNMKVILFGESLEQNEDVDSKTKKSGFSGIVYDYTFYSCSKCLICLKSDIETHTCCFESNRLKCSVCKLYFQTNKLKHHIKLHERDPDFLRSNMRIIEFHVPGNTNVNRALASTDLTDDNIELQSEPTLISDQIQSEVKKEDTNIYKCICGLHFLDQISLITHIKKCDPRLRVSKEKCAKCGLLFTSSVLFDHLIIHHGNRSHVYTFCIIDMSNQSDIIYKCSKCDLHFVNVNTINEHMRKCDGKADGKVCLFCNLKFESVSFTSHDCDHVNNVGAGSKVIILDEPLVGSPALVSLREKSPNKHKRQPNYSTRSSNTLELISDVNLSPTAELEKDYTDKLQSGIEAFDMESNQGNVQNNNIEVTSQVYTKQDSEVENLSIELNNQDISTDLDSQRNLIQIQNKELERVEISPPLTQSTTHDEKKEKVIKDELKQLDVVTSSTCERSDNMEPEDMDIDEDVVPGTTNQHIDSAADAEPISSSSDAMPVIPFDNEPRLSYPQHPQESSVYSQYTLGRVLRYVARDSDSDFTCDIDVRNSNNVPGEGSTSRGESHSGFRGNRGGPSHAYRDKRDGYYGPRRGNRGHYSGKRGGYYNGYRGGYYGGNRGGYYGGSSW